MTKATHCRAHFGLQIQRNIQATVMAGMNRKLKSTQQLHIGTERARSSNTQRLCPYDGLPLAMLHLRKGISIPLTWWSLTQTTRVPGPVLWLCLVHSPSGYHQRQVTANLDIEFPYSAFSFSDTVSFIYRWMGNRLCIHKESNFQC